MVLIWSFATVDVKQKDTVGGGDQSTGVGCGMVNEEKGWKMEDGRVCLVGSGGGAALELRN